MSFMSRSVPLIFQGETNECGLACVCMILNYFGRQTELASLRAVHRDTRPLSLETISNIAESHDLAVRALRCELEDLTKLQLPVIAHVDFDHFVVIDHCSRGSLSLLDPASGRLKTSLKAFSRRFTGIVIEARPTPDFKKDRGIKTNRTLEFLAKSPIAHLKRSLAGLLLLSVVTQAFALITPFYLQVTIDEVLLSNNIDLALVVTLSFAAVYLTSAITQSLRGLLTIKIGAKLTYLLSAGLLRHTTDLPVQFFERRNIGDIVSRFSAMRPVQDFISESLVGICLDLLMVITTFIMISVYSLQAALYVFSLCLVYLLVQYLLTLPYRAQLHEQLIAEAQVQSHFIETIQTIDSIKRFEGTARRRTAWLNHLVRSLNAHVRSRYWELAGKIACYLFLGMVLLGVVYISVEKIELGLLTIGMLYTLVTYSNHFTSALVSLTHEWQAYLMLSLHVGRVSDITDHPPDDRATFGLNEPVNRIQIKGLDFGHTDSHLLINDLNLLVQGSQKVAIVGASGSGKSTLFSLLRGDVSPVKGQILINNRPLLNNLNPVALYASLQPNDILLTGTVTDNIAFMDPAPDTSRIVAAASAALVHDDILRLPMSYSEKLSEQGCLLSAGQRQRILIARSLYRSAEILLLDEATSHLDAASELQIMKNILSLPVPCFFITHRPDIAALADHIVELKPSGSAQGPAHGHTHGHTQGPAQGPAHGHTVFAASQDHFA